MTKMQIHFALKGDTYDPSHVTKALGLQPDFTKEKGVADGDGEISIYTEWGINSETVDVVSSEELLIPFVSKMSRYKDLLLRVREECAAWWEMEIEVRIPYGNSFPELVFPQQVIKFTSDIYANLGFKIVFDYSR